MEKKKTIEDNFEELEDILKKMQDPQVTLDESFDLYNNGLKLVKDCNNHIEKIEKEIAIINEESVGDNE